jgi:pimeloyl-ACP methyl ester carboxylesterase
VSAPRALSVEHRGCTLRGEVRGEGPPVLFIQGVGVAGSGWRPQVDALAATHRCLSFDNRGMGQSQPLAGPLSVDLMADDALALLDAQRIERAHVVGHSLGGLVALALAQKAKARVQSLALLCTFATGAIPTRFDWKILSVGLRSNLGPRRARRRAFLELVLPPAARARADLDALAEQLGALFGHDLADTPPVAMNQLGAMRKVDLTAGLAGLAGLPTLVVSAAHDVIAPPHAGRAIAAGIPGARCVELPDASHGAPVHQAERVNALLREHLAAAG